VARLPRWRWIRIPIWTGEAIWRWRRQLALERAFAPVRAATVCLGGLVWWLTAGSTGFSRATWLVLGAAATFAAADFLVLRRYPRLVGSFPYGSALADAALVVAWIVATGGGGSTFVPLLFLSLVATEARLGLTRGGAAGFAVVYAAAYVALCGLPAGLTGGGVLLFTGLLCAWRDGVLGDQLKASRRDGLTGCFSRRFAEELIDAWLEEGLPFSIALVDLDGFKEVNDRCGHAAGDGVLVECVRILAAGMRLVDVVARFGGDEFLILSPGSREGECRAAVECITAKLAEVRVPRREGDGRVYVGASFGVAEARHGQDRSSLLGVADAELYRLKLARGRLAATPLLVPAARSATGNHDGATDVTRALPPGMDR
jgi:diguanylate cyclase (GGDEF)-like protein